MTVPALVSMRAAIEAQHGAIDAEPVGDGLPHGFNAGGAAPGQRLGWYLLFPNGWGCWGSGLLHGSGVRRAPGGRWLG